MMKLLSHAPVDGAADQLGKRFIHDTLPPVFTEGLYSFRYSDCRMDVYLPPATKLGQGYIFTGVCDSVHKGGGGIPAYIVGGIPACLTVGGAIPACIAGGIPACLAAGGCAIPACLAVGGSAPGGCLVQGDAWSGRGCLVETPWTATAAGGTHPTGMHSCFILKLLKLNAVLQQIILAEKQKSIHGSGEHWSVKDQRVRGAVEIEPDTPIKLIRKGVVRYEVYLFTVDVPQLSDPKSV